MRSKADETFVIVETLICPLQNAHFVFLVSPKTNYLVTGNSCLIYYVTASFVYTRSFTHFRSDAYQPIKVLFPQHAQSSTIYKYWHNNGKRHMQQKRVSVEACQSRADLAWLHDLNSQDIGYFVNRKL